eukprot:8728229-Lingulodinium_polyedra.AAC.1
MEVGTEAPVPSGLEGLGAPEDCHPPVQGHSLRLAGKGVQAGCCQPLPNVLIMPCRPPAHVLQDVAPVVGQEGVVKTTCCHQALHPFKGLLVELGTFPWPVVEVKDDHEQEDEGPEPCVRQGHFE